MYTHDLRNFSEQYMLKSEEIIHVSHVKNLTTVQRNFDLI